MFASLLESIEISEKRSLGEVILWVQSVKIQFQSRKLRGCVHNHKHQKKKKTPVQLYSTWRSYKINGLFALILLLSFLKNEYHYRRSLRCLPCNPLVLDYILLAASLKSKENIGPSDDPDVAEGAEKKYSQWHDINKSNVLMSRIISYHECQAKEFFHFTAPRGRLPLLAPLIRSASQSIIKLRPCSSAFHMAGF